MSGGLFDAERTVKDSGQTPGYLQTQFSPDAFGAQVGRALQGAGATLAQTSEVALALDKQKKQNDGLNQIQAAKNELRPTLFDPTYGVFAQQGGNAMGSGATVNAAMDNIKTKYTKDMDPDTAKVFDKLWGQEEDQTKDKVALHEMNESQSYKAQTAKTVLGGSITDAYNYYNDDKAIEKAKSDASDAIGVNSMGLDPESLQRAKDEANSQITLAVVSRWASEDPAKALEYLDKHTDELSGKDHVVASSLVNTAKDQRDADLDIARITKTGGAAAGQLFGKVVQAESGGDNSQISNKGAAGVSQIIPSTARDLFTQMGRPDLASLDDAGVKSFLTDPANRTMGLAMGQTYLNQQLQKYGGDNEAALVAYNAGPGSADKWLKANAGKAPGQRSYDIPGMPLLKSETQPYVEKILGGQIGGAGMSTPPGQRMTAQNWTLKNFKPSDILAPTAGGQFVDARAAQGLDALYDTMEARFPGLNISVNDKGAVVDGNTAGHRRGTADPADNPHVSHSEHLKGDAFDVQIQGWSDDQKASFITEARKLGFSGFGFYGPAGHLHIDMGNERHWGPVPSWATAALGTPVAQGPGLGSGVQATQPNPSAPGQDLSQLPSASSYFGIGANQGQGAFASTKAPDLQAWLAQADEISDPGRRSRVKDGLRVQAAQAEADNKASVASLKQTAWDSVLKGGFSKLPLEVLSQLGPEFTGQLRTYETNRVSGGPMPQDWKAWNDVSRMDPKDRVNVDAYTEYRNKLDDQHFDQLLSLQREDQKSLTGQAHDSSLLANTRSYGDIVKQTADVQGWNGINGDPTALQNFSTKLDQRILAAQAEKGEKLSSDDIQDIADKLVIEDKGSSWYGSSAQGQAKDVTKPDDFIAASSWDQVQPDDQKQLIGTYERYYSKTPTLEDATDLYNRGMRVWLGGKPDGPDPEKQLVRQSLETALGHTLTDQDFEKKYARYLLKFVGR